MNLEDCSEDAKTISYQFTGIYRLCQQWFTQGVPLEVIREVLKSAIPYLNSMNNVEGYLRAVMKVKRQNYSERQHIERHEIRQAKFEGFLDGLREYHQHIANRHHD